MAQWHGLAKLRLHTDDTLAHLDKLTSTLGEQLRIFQKKTCSAFKTEELPRETRARYRNQARQTAKKGTGYAKTPHSLKGPLSENAEPQKSKPLRSPVPKVTAFKPKLNRRSKNFNLYTYKNHSLGDYVEMIRKYGTVDSYTTELVSYIQKFKRFYSLC